MENSHNNFQKKENIGVRVYPEVKKRLFYGAARLGITVGAHAENIINSHDDRRKEIEELKKVNSVLNEVIAEKEEIIANYDSETKNFAKEFIQTKSDNYSLKKVVNNLTVQLNKSNSIISSNEEEYIKKIELLEKEIQKRDMADKDKLDTGEFFDELL